MTKAEMVFGEVTAQRKVASVPLSHLSIELGHLYREDLAAEEITGYGRRLGHHFKSIRPWVDALRHGFTDIRPGRAPRISTCFLVDDYFGEFSTPAELIPALVTAADSVGLQIDYLARESGCADADGVPLAALVESRLVDDPPPDTTGTRPPARETGWLSNGQRTPGSTEALSVVSGWAAPTENGARNHSIFVDVEMWNEQDGRRVWSCPFLAAVWQLLRLGLLRNLGEPVAVPAQLALADLPTSWAELPVVSQLTPRPAPFSAYRTASVLASRFLPVELAVRTILSQVHVDPDADQQVMTRSGAEAVTLPAEVVDRVSYVFLS
ncbi:MAG TPA: SCO2522 family protein [Mycobacteriales bacterium]|nr:SCO2522 family protein [Mycobacteriales bacterium]